MRFGPRITQEICEEFIKTPNIRYVCKKIGIDHSTFYRWLSKHHSFYQLVMGALAMGRDRMNDAAEGVIISGIQRNEFKSAKYWLAHNDPRYATSKQAEYLKGVNNNYIKILNEPTPDNNESTFQTFFETYETMQEVFGIEKAKDRIGKLVKIFCHGDTDLEKIFYASYFEWKTEKDNLNKKIADTKLPDIDP